VDASGQIALTGDQFSQALRSREETLPEAPSELAYRPSPVPEVANVQTQQVAPAQVSRGEARPIADPRQQIDRRKLAMLLMGGQA